MATNHFFDEIVLQGCETTQFKIAATVFELTLLIGICIFIVTVYVYSINTFGLNWTMTLICILAIAAHDVLPIVCSRSFGAEGGKKSRFRVQRSWTGVRK